MMDNCLTPTYLKDQRIYVACGHCAICKKRRTSEWTLRLLHEHHYQPTGSFITLTYNTQNIPLSQQNGKMTLFYRDFQLFMKRLRKRFPDAKMKYYVCGEYGPRTQRPHYHSIIYGLPHQDELEVYKSLSYPFPRYSSKVIDELWGKGFTTIGSITEETMRYCAGYVQKKLYGRDGRLAYQGIEPPLSRCSKGIGLMYCLAHQEEIKCELSISRGAFKYAVPRYYRKKLGLDADAYAETIRSASNQKFVEYRLATGLSPVMSPEFHASPIADCFRNVGWYDKLLKCYLTVHYIEWLKARARTKAAEIQFRMSTRRNLL